MKIFKNKKITKGSRQIKMNLEGKFSIIYSRKKYKELWESTTFTAKLGGKILTKK